MIKNLLFTTIEKQMLVKCYCGDVCKRTVAFCDWQPNKIYPKEPCEKCGRKCLVVEIKENTQ